MRIRSRLANGDVFIPLRPIVEGLGLDWSAQTQRINRDPILSTESPVCVVVTTTQGLPDQRRVGAQRRKTGVAQARRKRAI